MIHYTSDTTRETNMKKTPRIIPATKLHTTDPMLGTWAEFAQAGGEQVYIGGIPAIVRLRTSGVRLHVICQSCAYYRLSIDDIGLRRECSRNLTDDGAKFRIGYNPDARNYHRCSQWQPRQCWKTKPRGDGHVQTPDYVRWKQRNMELLTDSVQHGFPGRSVTLHRWLLRKYQESRNEAAEET